MTGEFLPVVLRLRTALDRAEEMANSATGGPWRPAIVFGTVFSDSAGYTVSQSRFLPDADFIAEHDPAFVLRTIQAHRAILDRHANTWHFDIQWMCRKCGNAGAPCRDVRDLASIYFPESDATQ